MGEAFYQKAAYYDILFGWDRSQELLFVDEVWRRHGLEPGNSALELACGTGVVSLHLAALGWRMSGLDLSCEMVDAYNERMDWAGSDARATQGDMADFHRDEPLDAVYSALGSIGLLRGDEVYRRHFSKVGAALREGGLYLLDVGLNPEGTAPLDLKAIDWGMEAGGVQVRAVDGQVEVRDPNVEGLQVFPWDQIPLEFEWNHLSSLWQDSGLVLRAIYGESGQDEQGISLFDAHRESDAQDLEDRAMVLLIKGATAEDS